MAEAAGAAILAAPSGGEEAPQSLLSKMRAISPMQLAIFVLYGFGLSILCWILWVQYGYKNGFGAGKCDQPIDTWLFVLACNTALTNMIVIGQKINSMEPSDSGDHASITGAPSIVGMEDAETQPRGRRSTGRESLKGRKKKKKKGGKMRSCLMGTGLAGCLGFAVFWFIKGNNWIFSAKQCDAKLQFAGRTVILIQYIELALLVLGFILAMLIAFTPLGSWLEACFEIVKGKMLTLQATMEEKQLLQPKRRSLFCLLLCFPQFDDRQFGETEDQRVMTHLFICLLFLVYVMFVFLFVIALTI